MREKRVLLSGRIILNYSNNTVYNDDNRLPMCSYVHIKCPSLALPSYVDAFGRPATVLEES